jgi:hypothetical protein
VPSGDTSIAGSNAATGTGVWLTLIGSDHVRPPSVDFERPISSRAPPLNRESHQAT